MYTPIKLDKMRNLRYGMRAIKTIEELTGKPISKIDFENMTMSDFSIVIYSGLSHEDKELTPDKVIDLIDEYSDIQTVAKTMSKAITQAFGRKNAQGAVQEKDEWDWDTAIKSAARIGICILDFWEYTPSEFVISIETYIEKQKDEIKALITQAYYTAALGRSKRMPKLEKLLKMKERKQMTAGEMLATVRQLNRAMGGDVSGNS